MYKPAEPDEPCEQVCEDAFTALILADKLDLYVILLDLLTSCLPTRCDRTAL